MKKLLIHYLMMSTRAFILAIGILVVSTSLLTAKNSYGQKPDIKKIFLSIKADQSPLKGIFNEIKSQTNISFFYNASSFDVYQPVSLHVDNKSLFYILGVISHQTGLEFRQINNHISVRPEPVATKEKQNQYLLPTIGEDTKVNIPERIELSRSLAYVKDTLVDGKVTDESGFALPGVTVQVKGTQKGTITDGYGRFSLEVPLGDTLLFSFIGYKEKKIAYKGKGRMLVELVPSAAGLNEVVVVGYGTQMKQDVISSVSQISGEELRRTPTANLQNALTGKLPGLVTQQRSGQPGGASAAKVYVRGASSFTGNNAPLILVDNVEYNYGQLFLIDPNTIKSISILKDAAATAIYGIKGADGVILITTKRGHIGKPTIHFKTQWGVQTPVHQLQTLNAYQSALLNNEALINAGLPPKFSYTDLKLFKSGADPYGHPDVEWRDVLFRNSTVITNNNIDVSGGTERVQYFISLGYMWQNGLLKDIPYKGKNKELTHVDDINQNYFMKRYKFRSNLDINATKSLHFKLDLVGTHEEANSPGAQSHINHLYEYGHLNPFMYPVYNPDGSFGYANPFRMTPIGHENNVAGIVALAGYKRNYNDFMDIHLSGIQQLDIITSGLSARGEIAFSYANTASRTISRSQEFPSYWFNPEDSTYLPRDANVYRIPKYNRSYSGGNPNRRLNIQGALNYEHSFGPNNISALLLFNQTSYIKHANPPFNFKGYTFRFTYNYKHKYLIGVSGAYNGSSRFVTQKRYSLFPALSAGYNIAKEPFFKKVFPFLETFKFRGSYGWVGSDDIGQNRYFYESVYRRSGSYSYGETDNHISGIIEDQQGNNDVSWETQRMADVGLDFSMFKGKISGSLDYFDYYRYDILTKRSTVPLFFGVKEGDLPPVNIGEVSNKGFEVELNYKDHIGQVGIFLKGTYSYAKNKILFMDEPPPRFPWQKATGLSIGMQKQYIWTGAFYQDQKDIDTSATPAGRVNPGFLKYKDLNGDGIINPDDMAYTGYPNLPNTNIGLTLGFDYKGIHFSVLLQSALNFDVITGFDRAVPFRTVLQPIHLGRWTPETAETATFPILTTYFNGSYMSPRGNPSTFWSVSGDYLRIKSMYLSYQIPDYLVNKVGLAAANVFINGYNLFTWSKMLEKYQYDPEIEPGSNKFVYPTQRIFNFGLRVTFK